MTKAGFKQIVVGIDTWGILKKITVNQRTSMNNIIKGLLLNKTNAFQANNSGSNPDRCILLSNKTSMKKVSIPEFERFLRLSKGLNDTTIKLHSYNVKTLMKSKQNTTSFLEEVKSTKSISMYNNYLKTFKILYRDFLKMPNEAINFKFLPRPIKPKLLPSKTDLKTFYDALPVSCKIIFLLLAESGLRIGELMNCHLDKENKMLIPNGHKGQTKQSWLSFYQSPIDEIPKITIKQIQRVFDNTSKSVNIKINPHLLRSIFAREMSKAGVQDRYIDAFCGRVPLTILAKSYTDFSPEVLKEVYNKANIKILPL